MSRLLLALPIAAALLFSLPRVARADGLVSETDVVTVDVTTAIAGKTRWSRITAPAETHVLWLVPTRPNAKVEWAQDGFLDALDDATTPRVLPPGSAPAPCSTSIQIEHTVPWARVGTRREPTTSTLNSETDLRALATQHGLTIPPIVSDQIRSLYAGGWVIVANELTAASTAGLATTATIRVTDDASPVLPFALSGGVNGETRVTAFTITEGAATATNANELAELSWGAASSNYVSWRDTVTYGGALLREASTHDALFDGIAIADGSAIDSVARTYFTRARGSAQPACEDAAKTAARSSGKVGAEISADSFTCGTADDLALALAGSAPDKAFVSRFVGRIARNQLGTDTAILPSDSPRSPVYRAGTYDRCPAAAAPAVAPRQEPAMPRQARGAHVVVGVAEGCGGSSTPVYEVADGIIAGGIASDDGDDTTSGSDTTDDPSTTDDPPADPPDDSTDDSSDDDNSSDDVNIDWGSDDGTKTDSKKLSMRDPSSPVSRAALLLGALVLPFRRRRRLA